MSKLTLKDYMENKTKQNEIKTIVALYNSINDDGENYAEILQMTPPASVLSIAIETIRDSTDLPLEIAFFNVIHYISAFLLQNNISIDFDGQKLKPDIHSVILAPSGSGKTYTQNIIDKSIPEQYVIKKFPNPDSDAAFFDALLKHNNSFFCRDEYAQFMKEVVSSKTMSKAKDYMLRTYDNQTIERTTKKDGEQKVSEPALTILGSTVDSTFHNYITEEMLLDGLAQRFSYFYATERKTKKARYSAHKNINSLKAEFQEVFDLVNYGEYVLNGQALNYFDSSFTALLATSEKVDYSFFRRIQFKLVKYALIYHVILKKDNNIIDKQDMAWADRIVYKNLRDLKTLLNNYSISDLAKKVKQAELIKERLEAIGKKLDTRTLISSIRSITNAGEAKFIMGLLES